MYERFMRTGCVAAVSNSNQEYSREEEGSSTILIFPDFCVFSTLGSNSENKMNDVPEDGNSSPVGRGLVAGVPVGLILVAVVAVVGFLI